MKSAEFVVDLTREDALRFAEISGDWNPLHVDANYASGTEFRKPILHGAYSAGLISRMAGMHLPGNDCLLHGMRLRFVSPIFPPAKLRVVANTLRSDDSGGDVEVTISDCDAGTLHVDASYAYGFHQHRQMDDRQGSEPSTTAQTDEGVVLVTGASGGLGGTLLNRLDNRGLGVSRTLKKQPRVLEVSGTTGLAAALGDRPVNAIVHCGWPAPDNQRLIGLGVNSAAAIHHHVVGPLNETVSLAQLLAEKGSPDATLVLIGSTASYPGRHAYRSPLYSLGKSMISTLVKILSVELGAQGRKCVGIEFDVIDGPGMNERLSDADRQRHADRSPFGQLASVDEAAQQIEWLLNNRSGLISGAMVTLTGGALP